MYRVLCAGLAVAAACGGGGTDYLGEPPAEAGEALAGKACDEIYECGVLLVTCGETCTAAYQPAEAWYVDEAACQLDTANFLTRRLIGCAAAHLTDDERAVINDCLSVAPHCYDADELATIAAAATAGQAYGPVECQAAADLLDLCDLCADTPSAPACL